MPPLQTNVAIFKKIRSQKKKLLAWELSYACNKCLRLFAHRNLVTGGDFENKFF
jgi:hypothetical protein